MRIPMPTLALLVPLSLMACGGTPAQDEGLSVQTASLTSGVSRGCTFTISSRSKGGFPPQYEAVVTRAASSSCAWGSASVVLGSSYNTPALSLDANDLGVAVSFTTKNTPSGSAAISLSLRHLAPDTLAVVRSTSLNAMNSFYAGYVYSGDVGILTDGTTLEVRGTKSGTIPGETGSGSNYVATYPNFFTSTTAPSVVAY